MLSDTFVTTKENHVKEFDEKASRYLISIYYRLIKNNELLLDGGVRPRFYLVEANVPIIFSMPTGNFFMSRGLLEKYLKSEDLFVAALSYEIIKSVRGIYEKKTIVPLGYIKLDRILSLSRVKLAIKTKINEWTYLMMLRSGYDPSTYLNWIQVQNKNVLDFSLQLGDTSTINKEEFAFKNLMVKNGINTAEKNKEDGNSSKDFYEFIQTFKERK